MSIEVKLSTQKLTTTNNSIKKKCICISFRDESNNFRIRLVSLLNIDRIAEENARTQPHVACCTNAVDLVSHRNSCECIEERHKAIVCTLHSVNTLNVVCLGNIQYFLESATIDNSMPNILHVG